MAAPAIIGTPSGVAYAGGGGSSSTNLAVPTNVADDLLIAIVNGISGISMPTLSGWTKFLDEDYVFTGDSSTQYGVEAWYRISNGSEPGNYALSHNAFTPFKANMIVVRGAADPGDIAIVADAAPDEVVDADHPAPSVTVTADESLIIRSVCQRLTGITYTPPGSHSEIYDDGATWGSVALATTTANAGASGTGTFVDDAGWPPSFMLATIAIAPLAGVSISSASLNAAGDELTVNLSAATTITNATGLTIAFDNRASRTLAYTSGSGTATLKFSLAAVSPSTDGRAPVGTTALLTYDADTGNIADLEDVTNQAVTNNSTQIPRPDLPQNLPSMALPAHAYDPADHAPANAAALQALLDDFGGALLAGHIIDLNPAVDYGSPSIPEGVKGTLGNEIIVRTSAHADLPAFSATNPAAIPDPDDPALVWLTRTPSADNHYLVNISGGTAGAGASYIRFIGVHFRFEGSYGTDVLAMVTTLTAGLASAVDKLPRGIGFDRCCWSHAGTMKGVQDALRLDADDSFVVGCNFTGLKGAGNDGSNATRCYRAHRILIQNNYFNCNGASGFLGDNDLTEVQDYAFRYNWHERDPSWGSGAGNNKASHEAKCGLRVDVSFNVFDYQFAAAGFGAICVKAEGTGGPKLTQHYNATGNRATNCEQFAVILAGGSSNDDDVGPNTDIYFRDNLGYNLNTRGIQLSVYNSPADAPMMRLTIIENTIFGGFFVSGSDDGLTPGAHFIYRDNIQNGLFGIWFNNGGAARCQGLNYSWGADYSATYNLLIGEDVGNWDDNSSPAPLGTLENNLFPADIAAVGFTDPDNDDYSISNASDYAAASSTGGKPGYDAATYDAIWQGIIAGATAPVNTVAPSISLFPYATKTIETDNGTWDNDPTSYTYQWRLADDGAGTGAADITGETSDSLTLNSDYWGKYVRCVVTATNDGGSASANATLFGSTWFYVFAPVARDAVTYLEDEWDDFATEDNADIFNETIGDGTNDLIPFPLTFDTGLNARYRAPWFCVASEFNGVVGRATDAKAGCGATLISPRHVLMVQHCKPSAVYFKQADGTEVYREIEWWDWINYDLAVGRLDSEITTIDPVPIIARGQTAVGKTGALIEAGRFLSTLVITECGEFFSVSSSETETGDSGHPVFIVNGDQPVLVGIISGVGTEDVGHAAPANIDRINAILALYSESLTLVDVQQETTGLGAAFASGFAASRSSAQASTSITAAI